MILEACAKKITITDRLRIPIAHANPHSTRRRLHVANKLENSGPATPDGLSEHL